MPSWCIDRTSPDLPPWSSTSVQSSSTYQLHPGPISIHLPCGDRSASLHGSSAEQHWTSSSGSHHCCRRWATPETEVPNWTSLKPHTTHHTPHRTPPHHTPPPHVFKSGSPKVLKCCKYCMLYIIYYIPGVDIYIYIYIYIYKRSHMSVAICTYYILYIYDI